VRLRVTINCAFLTQKERDNESGLDYFGARYYGSNLGRFTSPDPLFASGRATSPQTWNRYAYVLNNPLRLIDPNGLVEDESQNQNDKPKKQRVIYLFVAFKGDELLTHVIDGKTKKPTGEYAKTPITLEDLKKAAKASGVDLKVFTDVKKSEFVDALKDGNADAVIFIGHGYSSEPEVSPYYPDEGVMMSNGEASNPKGEAIDVSAKNIAIFACQSEATKDMFKATSTNKSFIGIDSGANDDRDGLTTTGAITRAGFAATMQYIKGNSPDAAVLKANSALNPVEKNGQPMNRPTEDKGDRVVRPR